MAISNFRTLELSNFRTSSAYILAGATATGKSGVAQALAEQMGCAILSADTMLV